MKKLDRAVVAAQVERLLLAHPHIGASARPLVDVLERCDYRAFQPGTVICREGEPGEEMYVLLRGRIQVKKRDRGDVDRDLLEIYAPAMLGHMSLVDRSPRSATCVAVDHAYVGVIDRSRYQEILSDNGAQGTALRRLLLSSLTRQMILGVRKLEDLLQPAVDSDDISDAQLLELAGALNGWELQTEGVDAVEYTEDYDTKRARTDSRRRS